MKTIKLLRIEDDYHRQTQQVMDRCRTVLPMNEANKPPIMRKADEQSEKQRQMIERLVQSEQE